MTNVYNEVETAKSTGTLRSGAPITVGRTAKQMSNIEGTQSSEISINKSEREDPFHILKVRFAKGEISKEEYDEMRKVLE